MPEITEYWRELVRVLSDKEVLEMQTLIAQLAYRISTPEFRDRGDALEAELTSRGLAFPPIDWTVPEEQ